MNLKWRLEPPDDPPEPEGWWPLGRGPGSGQGLMLDCVSSSWMIRGTNGTELTQVFIRVWSRSTWRWSVVPSDACPDVVGSAERVCVEATHTPAFPGVPLSDRSGIRLSKSLVRIWAVFSGADVATQRDAWTPTVQEQTINSIFRFQDKHLQPQMSPVCV